MRTTLDFPNDLFVHLKTRAAIDGVTLRETVIGLLEKGLTASDAQIGAGSEAIKYYPPPTIPSKGPMAISMKSLSNVDLYELMDAETLTRDAYGAQPA
jgi:hypothetical protein